MSLLPRTTAFDFGDFGDFFDSFYSPLSNQQSPEFFSPKVDIRDRADHYEIIADLPGIDKDNLSVTVENNVLTIEASAEEESEEKQGRLLRRERRAGSYLRTFNLGHEIREADIKASFKNGVLTLEAPKSEEAMPDRKRIEVQ